MPAREYLRRIGGIGAGAGIQREEEIQNCTSENSNTQDKSVLLFN
jgi:hypothetical protein